ncbi:MAG: hypothetical protein ACTSW1_07395 [Candidatus Hodarchaeales archaeon]
MTKFIVRMFWDLVKIGAYFFETLVLPITVLVFWSFLIYYFDVQTKASLIDGGLVVCVVAWAVWRIRTLSTMFYEDAMESECEKE